MSAKKPTNRRQKEQNELKDSIKSTKKTSAVRAFINEIDAEEQPAQNVSPTLVTNSTDEEQETEDKQPESNEPSEKEKTTIVEELKELDIETSEDQEDEMFWDNIKNTNLNQRKDKVLTSFYMDGDLFEVVDYIYQRMGKGFKTKIINHSVRKALKENGLL